MNGLLILRVPLALTSPLGFFGKMAKIREWWKKFRLNIYILHFFQKIEKFAKQSSKHGLLMLRVPWALTYPPGNIFEKWPKYGGVLPPRGNYFFLKNGQNTGGEKNIINIYIYYIFSQKFQKIPKQSSRAQQNAERVLSKVSSIYLLPYFQVGVRQSVRDGKFQERYKVISSITLIWYAVSTWGQ